MKSKKNIYCMMSLVCLFGTQWATMTSVTLCTLAELHAKQNHEQKLKNLTHKYVAWDSCEHAFCKLCLSELCYLSKTRSIKCPECYPKLWVKKSLQKPLAMPDLYPKDPILASLLILLIGVVVWSW